ncbi:hypothetical protein BC835DRAFT_1309321 [Cytidiella melzeri]|nr:hypothetical protein BC835DRAFT_1309321 [Cytidiella melzeri]
MFVVAQGALHNAEDFTAHRDTMQDSKWFHDASILDKNLDASPPPLHNIESHHKYLGIGYKQGLGTQGTRVLVNEGRANMRTSNCSLMTTSQMQYSAGNTRKSFSKLSSSILPHKTLADDGHFESAHSVVDLCSSSTPRLRHTLCMPTALYNNTTQEPHNRARSHVMLGSGFVRSSDRGWWNRPMAGNIAVNLLFERLRGNVRGEEIVARFICVELRTEERVEERERESETKTKNAGAGYLSNGVVYPVVGDITNHEVQKTIALRSHNIGGPCRLHNWGHICTQHPRDLAGDLCYQGLYCLHQSAEQLYAARRRRVHNQSLGTNIYTSPNADYLHEPPLVINSISSIFDGLRTRFAYDSYFYFAIVPLQLHYDGPVLGCLSPFAVEVEQVAGRAPSLSYQLKPARQWQWQALEQLMLCLQCCLLRRISSTYLETATTPNSSSFGYSSAWPTAARAILATRLARAVFTLRFAFLLYLLMKEEVAGTHVWEDISQDEHAIPLTMCNVLRTSWICDWSIPQI